MNFGELSTDLTAMDLEYLNGIFEEMDNKAYFGGNEW